MNKSTLICLLLLALLSAQTFSLSYNKEEHLISHNYDKTIRSRIAPFRYLGARLAKEAKKELR
jgi:hypothetical protein